MKLLQFKDAEGLNIALILVKTKIDSAETENKVDEIATEAFNVAYESKQTISDMVDYIIDELDNRGFESERAFVTEIFLN